MKRSLGIFTLDSLLIDRVGRGYRRGIVLSHETGASISSFSEPAVPLLSRWDLLEDEDGLLRCTHRSVPMPPQQQGNLQVGRVFASARIQRDGTRSEWMHVETFGAASMDLHPNDGFSLDHFPDALCIFCDKSLPQAWPLLIHNDAVTASA